MQGLQSIPPMPVHTLTKRTCVTAVTAKPRALVAAITLALCFSAAHTTPAMAVVAIWSGSAAAAMAVGRWR